MLSIILPSYNEQGNITRAYSTITNLLTREAIPYEIIFIDDGSQDNTWEEITVLCGQSANIKGICFSRNFGKESAILSGLAYSKGDCCIVMDCDLQHPVETIIEMYDKWKQGYEIVDGVKSDRGKENLLHKTAANIFYSILSKATKIDMANASDFKLIDRKVVNILLQMPEHQPFFRALSAWVGFKKTTVEFKVQPREIGNSKWSISALIRYAISNLASFSMLPLQIITVLGTISCLFCIILGIHTLYCFFFGIVIHNNTVIILLLLLIGGILMLGLGIIGYYIARIYDEVRSRPRYIITEFLN